MANSSAVYHNFSCRTVTGQNFGHTDHRATVPYMQKRIAIYVPEKFALYVPEKFALLLTYLPNFLTRSVKKKSAVILLQMQSLELPLNLF